LGAINAYGYYGVADVWKLAYAILAGSASPHLLLRSTGGRFNYRGG